MTRRWTASVATVLVRIKLEVNKIDWCGKQSDGRCLVTTYNLGGRFRRSLAVPTQWVSADMREYSPKRWIRVWIEPYVGMDELHSSQTLQKHLGAWKVIQCHVLCYVTVSSLLAYLHQRSTLFNRESICYHSLQTKTRHLQRTVVVGSSSRSSAGSESSPIFFAHRGQSMGLYLVPRPSYENDVQLFRSERVKRLSE